MDPSFEQLKKIIHGLKMHGLSFVDQDALSGIQAQIKYLPSPEELDKLNGSPDKLKQVKKQVGEIMALIEAYGKRNLEQEKRNLSIKKLPPRYKHLEWRNNMDKAAQVEVVKGMIKVSSRLDECGQEILSHKTLVCAQNIANGDFNENDIKFLEKEIKAAGHEKLLKEAYWGESFVGGVKNMLAPAKEKFKEGYQNVKNQKAEKEKQAKVFKILKSITSLDDYAKIPQIMKQLDMVGGPGTADKYFGEANVNAVNAIASAIEAGNAIYQKSIEVVNSWGQPAPAPAAPPAAAPAPASVAASSDPIEEAGLNTTEPQRGTTAKKSLNKIVNG